jgi:hypothetical protein
MVNINDLVKRVVSHVKDKATTYTLLGTLVLGSLPYGCSDPEPFVGIKDGNPVCLQEKCIEISEERYSILGSPRRDCLERGIVEVPEEYCNGN